MSVNRHPNTQGVTIKQWRYTATGGETTLSGTDGFSQSLTYTPGAEEVFVNGVLLVRGTDYTASTGTTVVLNNALVAGDIATVSAPSVFNVANSIPSSTVAAKGDLLVGNGAASVTNLGVGADGSTLVANSSAGAGISWVGPVVTAGKNILINGGFDIWQRGTTFTNPSNNNYLADRWTVQDSSGATTVTQQTTGAPNGSRYIMRVATTTSSNHANIAQLVETANAQVLWGQTAIFSIKLRRNSSMSSGIDLYLQKSSTVDAGNGATWTTITTATVSNANLPTGTGSSNWYLASISGAIPNDGTANSLRLIIVPTSGALNSGDYFEMAQAQLEIGSTPTAFSRAGGTLQGELAACQRYYQVIPANLSGWSGNCTNGSLYVGQTIFPVQMRTAPTIGTWTANSVNGFPNSASTNTITSSGFQTYNTANSTTNGAYFFGSTTASAEL